MTVRENQLFGPGFVISPKFQQCQSFDSVRELTVIWLARKHSLKTREIYNLITKYYHYL